jgi:methylmalonyl-CoA mutase cobalamin-binding subunit
MLFGGGVIPEADAVSLKERGLAEEIFTSGTTMVSITEWLAAALDDREAAPA